jgi:hypothetical protein
MVVRSEEHLRLGCLYASIEYGEKRVTTEQVRALFYFLRNADAISFDDCVPVAQPVLSN